MLGTRETFEYVECNECGCLQICEIPDDIARHYPSSYYAFAPSAAQHGLRGWLRRKRNAAAITGDGVVGRLLATLKPYPFADVTRWFRRMGVSKTSRILDVGCGMGELLRDLGEAGFRSLTGVDPFIPRDVAYASGAKVFKATIHDMHGRFDLVVLNHAFEHIPDQFETLQAVASRLAPGGHCLVRVPTVSSYAWEHYREDWVQLDAPRHFFLHSLKSLRLLGERAGLTLQAVEFDSTELQFAGSELYRRDRPWTVGMPGYSRAELRRFRAQARALNAEGRGDQAAFHFTAAPRPASA
jgi:SAM-dependent methyltransferase